MQNQNISFQSPNKQNPNHSSTPPQQSDSSPSKQMQQNEQPMSQEDRRKGLADKEKIENKQQPNYKELYEGEKKKVQELTKQLQIERIKIKKLQPGSKHKGKLCTNCLNEIEDGPDDKINQFRGFSTKINTVLQKKEHKKMNKSKVEKKLSFDHQLSYDKSNNFKMFQNFAILGINDENIQNFLSEEQEPELLFSLNKPSEVDIQASRFAFPSGAAIKRFSASRAKEKAIEIMSYSYTNLKSFILRFKCQENIDQKQYQKNEVLMHLNPEKQLFCLCIGISDYTAVEKIEKSELEMNSCILEYDRPKQKQDSRLEGDFTSQPSNKTISSNASSLSSGGVIVSQRVFCITSYYPFFTFYEEILRNLINIVKMERLMIYKHNDEDIKASDSSFQLKRMKSFFQEGMGALNAKKIQFNRSYEQRLENHQKITLLTDWNIAKNYFVDEWIFSILNMFTAETFIDVFSLLMLEDRIVFICDNSHILTYTIYLFVSLLTKPFMYAFEVVTIIPDEDFLGAPFSIVYGMLKKRKYVEERRIMDLYKNTYIFLSPEKVEVVYTEDRKELLKARPMKLKNQLNILFKEMKKYRKISPKATKYEIQMPEYALSSSVEERQLAIKIIQKMNDFMMSDVVNKLPNEIEIRKMKNSIDQKDLPEDKDEHSYLMQQISFNLRKFNKDPFLDKFLQTQMMSQYVFK